MRIRCSVLPYPHLPSQTLFPFQRPVLFTTVSISPVLQFGSPVLSAVSSLSRTPQTQPYPLPPCATFCSTSSPSQHPQGLPSSPHWPCSVLHWEWTADLLLSPLSQGAHIINPFYPICSLFWLFSTNPKPYTILTPAIFSFLLIPSPLLALPLLLAFFPSLPWTTRTHKTRFSPLAVNRHTPLWFYNKALASFSKRPLCILATDLRPLFYLSPISKHTNPITSFQNSQAIKFCPQ